MSWWIELERGNASPKAVTLGVGGITLGSDRSSGARIPSAPPLFGRLGLSRGRPSLLTSKGLRALSEGESFVVGGSQWVLRRGVCPVEPQDGEEETTVSDDTPTVLADSVAATELIEGSWRAKHEEAGRSLWRQRLPLRLAGRLGYASLAFSLGLALGMVLSGGGSGGGKQQVRVCAAEGSSVLALTGEAQTPPVLSAEDEVQGIGGHELGLMEDLALSRAWAQTDSDSLRQRLDQELERRRHLLRGRERLCRKRSDRACMEAVQLRLKDLEQGR